MARSRQLVVDALNALRAASKFLASPSPSAAGHLGLVRALPGVGDLKAIITPEALLLDAAHALGAAALRQPPSIGAAARAIRDLAPEVYAKAEAAGDTETAKAGRFYLALLDAEEGRFEDALDDLALQAAADPDRAAPRLGAAALCEVLGRADEAERWASCITGDLPPRDYAAYEYALVVAALGGAPGAVAGSRGSVTSAALRFIYTNLWTDDDVSVLKALVISGLMSLLVRRKLRRADAAAAAAAVPGVIEFLLGTGSNKGPGPGSPVSAPYLLRASQALLSAAVLGAPPLCAERIRAATSAAEGELARAVERGDTHAAADLRLLLAFLAARDGRFDDAMNKYKEAAREHPSDPRPHKLGCVVFLVADKMADADAWKRRYERLAATEGDRAEHDALRDEVLIALALGGARSALSEDLVRGTADAAGSRVDAALVAALAAEEASVGERAELLALRALVSRTRKAAAAAAAPATE
ncbi:unnamed protein product [Urochloa decumbens]|uniref:Uncharacterized protein n=1 Tax=Urochloa decumbens TaxID=240449 RepID=A0ABC8WB66_9POAL